MKAQFDVNVSIVVEINGQKIPIEACMTILVDSILQIHTN